MFSLHPLHRVARQRFALLLIAAVWLLIASGCSSIYKRRVTVPPLLEPLKSAETAQLLNEVNRLAAVRSLSGKADIQFLDNSFAKCGVAEKYRTAEGRIVLQREGQIYLAIQAPFVGTKIAEMTSDGEHFRVAVFKGDEKYLRFVKGTNSADYQRMQGHAEAETDCGAGGQQKSTTMQRRAVGALSGLRPQHFTDALLVRPVGGANLIYARSEAFAEDADPRPNAKRGARVVHGYYVLDELAPEGQARARLLRRFWFDRFDNVRLARLQTFADDGQLTTDVVYKNPQNFGGDGSHLLPANIELTRPHERYSLSIAYQTPAEIKIDQTYPPDVFMLENKTSLPEVDLDKQKE